jgi:DNA-binding transcriptional LysR family regulator
MLDLRRLRLLRELRDRGTVTAVADAFNYTPSAVSQQLTALEREAGIALTERIGRGVRLTDAGRALADHTDGVLARLEYAEAELAAAASGAVRGRVRVSAFQTAARSLVVPVMRPLADRHAGLRVELDEMEAEDALAPLRAGDIDIAIAEEYEQAPRERHLGIERIELGTDRILLALPKDHRLAREDKPVRLSRLAGEYWCGTRENTRFGDLLVNACRAAGFEPDIRHRANDVALLTELAADRHGVALVPALGRPELNPGVAIRPLAGTRIDRSIFAAVRRGSAGRPTFAATLEALQTRAAELGLA